MYNHGMKMLCYSTKRAEETGTGWYRTGKDIAYYQSQKKNTLYVLSFCYSPLYDQDEVYFAHSFPYTFTDYKIMLNDVITLKARDIARRTVLCQSLAGNQLDLIIITNFSSPDNDIG